MNNKLCIVVEICTECGGGMSATSARVEDAGETGVIDCTCEACGNTVTISVTNKAEE